MAIVGILEDQEGGVSKGGWGVGGDLKNSLDVGELGSDILRLFVQPFELCSRCRFLVLCARKFRTLLGGCFCFLWGCETARAAVPSSCLLLNSGASSSERAGKWSRTTLILGVGGRWWGELR